MMQGSIIAIIGLTLLLVIPFRGVVEPFFAIVALLVGVAWSFGFTTLVVGHLNLLSAVFTSVLAGIGINFPIHLMARYDEARRRGLKMPEALELAVVNTGTGSFRLGLYHGARLPDADVHRLPRYRGTGRDFGRRPLALPDLGDCWSFPP